ncbi:hypothetical protein BC833DRAFT_597686 [Globomyces pollinis-pini]|nr:hypothetical protein BC833DRAFT_597686 [Globomyces pollinis-pini]
MTTDKPNTISAIKTAFNHLSRFQKEPVPGVSICQLSPLLFHVNSTVLEGPYAGIVVHWELLLNENYPNSAPFGRIVKGYPLTHKYHQNIYGSKGICADFLGNIKYIHQNTTVGSGWTSSSDFIGLMINMQAFFANPDVAVNDIDELKALDSNYKCQECAHSTESPYPPILKQISIDSQPSTILNTVEGARARAELVCTVTKENAIDNPDLFLGYPIMVTRDKSKRIHSTLIPELVSYNAYMTEYQIAKSKGTDLKTSTGECYTNWLPIYLDEKRFVHNRAIFMTTMSVIAKGESGRAKNDFKSEMILSVIPTLMNQQVVSILNGEIYESEAIIKAYTSLLRLLKRLIVVFPALQNSIDQTVANFLDYRQKRHKSACPDLGVFLIKLSLASPDKTKLTYHNPLMKQALLLEYFSRQIRWIRNRNSSLINTIDDIDTSIQTKIDLLPELFKASKTSNQLLTFNLEMAKTFIVPAFAVSMDANSGLLPTKVISNFQNRIKLIKAKVVDYYSFLSSIKFLDTLSSREEVVAFIKLAICNSRAQRYD